MWKILRDLRTYFQLGTKYTGIVNITLMLITVVGVWLGGFKLIYKIPLLVIGIIVIMICIIIAGYLDIKLGFLQNDIKLNEEQSIFYKQQMIANRVILDKLEKIENEIKNK